MRLRFGITFDYLCPFARNANEHVVAALRGGADWDVDFVPYSLAQGHVEEGQPDVWDHDDPEAASGILALEVGLLVRDRYPDAFLDVHEALFAARHDEGGDLKDPKVLAAALRTAGLDAEAVLADVAEGEVREQLRKEHDAGVAEYHVWGVPTFIAGDRAVFVRLMDRPEGDVAKATRSIEQVIDLVVNAPMLHEFKQTDLPR
ncbi:DsbA family protein [Egicoccus sp. AB-alg6-2]|uniref:DsbA family oxidoreductase n=1 Tax=Egicoccus sp. AB-alg6-2 TaxID=3242692 RepID=UPI00359EC776